MDSACPALVSHWWNWHPLVGFSIAILGLLGVLVPLYRPWGDISRKERSSWTVLLFLLLGSEIRTLYLDRAASDREQDHARCEQLRSFERIAANIKAVSDDSQRHFEFTMGELSKDEQARQRQFDATIAGLSSVLSRTGSVEHLATESILDITGGDAYAYVEPSNFKGTKKLDFNVINAGDRTLTGVVLRAARVLNHCPDYAHPKPCQIHTNLGLATPMSIGIIGPQQVATGPSFIDADPNGTGSSQYHIEISAQNGTAYEDLWFRPAKDRTGYAYKFVVTAMAQSKRGVKDAFGARSMRVVKSTDWEEPYSPSDLHNINK